jgi:hypothetical protein
LRALTTRIVPVRRFRPPWSVEEMDACFVIGDAQGRVLGRNVWRCGERMRRNCCGWPSPLLVQGISQHQDEFEALANKRGIYGQSSPSPISPQGFRHSSFGPVTPTRFFAVVRGGAGDGPASLCQKEASESYLQGLKVNAKWVRRRISNGKSAAGQ